MLAAGKMHAAGILAEQGEHIITKEDIASFVQAGADIILLPAPGTVPGITMEYVRTLVSYAHALGALTITAIGTSQEGADAATIREIALLCKMAGTDMHHIGDTGYPRHFSARKHHGLFGGYSRCAAHLPPHGGLH